jgi:hypothetical protein
LYSSPKIKTAFGWAFKNVPQKSSANSGMNYYLIKFLAKSQEIFFLFKLGRNIGIFLLSCNKIGILPFENMFWLEG